VTNIFDDHKHKTAEEIFDCLEEIDEVEDIRKLKPSVRTKLLLKTSSRIALDGKRSW
jgi:hypothetical protein